MQNIYFGSHLSEIRSLNQKLSFRKPAKIGPKQATNFGEIQYNNNVHFEGVNSFAARILPLSARAKQGPI